MKQQQKGTAPQEKNRLHYSMEVAITEMGFQKISQQEYPLRQWALVGYPGSGKSTFAAQLAGPLLVVDADHRFNEVADLAQKDAYQISDNPADHLDERRIQDLLHENMPESNVGTIVIDSLTAIISPHVARGMLDNAAGDNKNRSSAFVDKSLVMRLLQDAITMWGTDTLWVYHLQSGRDQNGQPSETTTVSKTELERLRRSLNMQLCVVQKENRRGIRVDWARRGEAGMTLWDETGCWAGMPERIEYAVYGASATARQFTSKDEAIQWAVNLKAFLSQEEATKAYEESREENAPETAGDMWEVWHVVVHDMLTQKNGNHTERTAT